MPTTVGASGEYEAIIKDLLEYLTEHPGAVDTVEGIQKWWLRNRHPLVAVEAVVAMLNEEELFQSHEFTPGLRVYGVPEEARPKVHARLEAVSGKG